MAAELGGVSFNSEEDEPLKWLPYFYKSLRVNAFGTPSSGGDSWPRWITGEGKLSIEGSSFLAIGRARRYNVDDLVDTNRRF